MVAERALGCGFDGWRCAREKLDRLDEEVENVLREGEAEVPAVHKKHITKGQCVRLMTWPECAEHEIFKMSRSRSPLLDTSESPALIYDSCNFLRSRRHIVDGFLKDHIFGLRAFFKALTTISKSFIVSIIFSPEWCNNIIEPCINFEAKKFVCTV